MLGRARRILVGRGRTLLIAAAIALGGGVAVLAWITVRRRIPAWALIVNAALYVAYVAYVVVWVI
jgi:hypothetical protein